MSVRPSRAISRSSSGTGMSADSPPAIRASARAATVGRERVERLGLGGETLEGGRARSARGARPGDGTAGELAETPQPRRAGEAVLHREPQRWDERRERLLRGGKAGGDLPGGGHVALVAPPLHGARLPARSDYSPDSPGSSSSTNEMDWISYSFWPPGVRTVTVSPSSRPMSARAMGLVTEMRPTLRSASSSPTIR